MKALQRLSGTFHADLVGQVYEAALDPLRWRDVVDTLADVYPDSRVTMFSHRNGRPEVTLHKHFEAADLKAYVDHYVKNSPYILHLNRLTVGRVNFSEEQISLAELKATEHFNDFIGPRRIGFHATGILLERRAGGLTSLSISDMKDDSQRRSHQKRLLQAVAPHVLRSLALGRAIAAQQAASTATRAAFDRWLDAAFVLGAEGRLVTMNKAAAEMVRGSDCISLDGDGSLRSFDDGVSASVNAAVRKCLDVCDKLDLTISDVDRSGIILPRRSSATPLHALLWPLPYIDEHPEFGANGRVLVMVFDPARTQRTSVGWIVQRFRLAASEGALVEALVNGETLAEAAERFGIQLSTARTRLKAIQLKTGCSRQVDLVRLALSQPDVRQD